MKTIYFIYFSILIFSSSSTYSQWVQTNGPYGGTVWSMVYSNSKIYAGTTNGIYITQNGGQNWFQTSLTASTHAITISNTKLIAGVTDNGGYGIYVSTNEGQSWLQKYSSVGIHSFLIYGSKIFAGGGNGIHLSTNDGENWAPLFYTTVTMAMTIKDSIIFAGTQGSGIYRSTNNGIHFYQSPLGFNYYISSLVNNESNIYAGSNVISDGGVFISNDNGTTWAHHLQNVHVNALALSSGNIFAACSYPNNGVYLSTNNGINWIWRSEGFETTDIFSLLVAGDYIYAGAGNTVWKRLLSELIGIKTINSSIPERYNLYQNYPNPFNPETKIKFQVSENENIKITIFNALGQEVKIILNSRVNPGTYEIDYNADNLNSGVYYYKMQAGDFSQTNKMVLVK